jgi:hypothetical protein
MADRFCGHCGHELRPEDQFCPNCGQPVHETARVPTPEADVPLPPPPSPEGAGGGEMSPPQDRQFPPDRSLETGPKIFLGLSAVVTLISGRNGHTARNLSNQGGFTKLLLRKAKELYRRYE